MQVVSVNISDIQTIEWRGQEVETGIFKRSVDHPVRIDSTGVSGDNVVDRKWHGSPDMAVYLYSSDCYSYWKEKYPNLDWNYGMFGENLTIEGLNEAMLNIGDRLQVGETLVEISQPRQPCFKLGVKFGTQGIIKDFINSPYPGLYVRVLEPGTINKGDKVTVLTNSEATLPVLDIWRVMYNQDRSEFDVNRVLSDPFLSDESKDSLRRKIQND